MFKKVISAATAVAVAATPLLVGAPAANAVFGVDNPPPTVWKFGNDLGQPIGGSTVYAFAKPGLGLFSATSEEDQRNGIIGSAARVRMVNGIGASFSADGGYSDQLEAAPNIKVISGMCALELNAEARTVKPNTQDGDLNVFSGGKIAIAASAPGDCVIQAEGGDTLNVKILPEDQITAPVGASDRVSAITYDFGAGSGYPRGVNVESATISTNLRYPLGMKIYFDNIKLADFGSLDGRRTSIVSGPCKVSDKNGGITGDEEPTAYSPVWVYGTSLGDCTLRIRYGSFYKDIPITVEKGNGPPTVCSEECIVSDFFPFPPPTCDTPGCTGPEDRSNPEVPGPPPVFDPEGPLNEQPNSVPTAGPRGATPVIIQLDEIKKVKAVEAQTFKKFSARIKSKDRKALKKWGKQNTKSKNTVLVTVGYAGFNAKRDLQINLVSAKRAKNTANAVLKNPKKSTFLAKGTTPAQLKKLLGKKKAKKVFKKGGNRVAIVMAVTLK